MTIPLEDRRWEITVGTLRLSPGRLKGHDLQVQFEVDKTLAREPNTATVKIANLSPTHRRAIEQLSDDAQLQIKAGYKDLIEVIFLGDIEYAQSDRDSVTVWTSIESSDRGSSYRSARIVRTFDRGVSLETVLRACADSLGVGAGNVSSVASTAQLDSGGAVFQEGLAVDDLASRVMDDVCRSASLRWTVHNGVLQLRQAGQPLETRAIRLAPGTGLIGSPSKSKPERRSGSVTVSAKANLIPGLYPGRVVRLESSEVSGSYMVKRVRYQGDTAGQDWVADLVLEEY